MCNHLFIIKKYGMTCIKKECIRCKYSFFIKPFFKKINSPVHIFEAIYRNFINHTNLVNISNINKINYNYYIDKYNIYIPNLGNHSRIGGLEINNIIYPNWLYYIDMWFCRLDAEGDGNLILINDKAIPIDFGLSFPWTYKKYNPNYKNILYKINYKNKLIIESKNDLIKNYIINIKRKDLYNILSENIIDLYLLNSIVSGLMLRKEIIINL